MKIELKLKLPSVPNYIHIEMPPGFKQDGFKEGPSLHISDLSDEQLKEIGKAWTEALIAKARTPQKDVEVRR